MNFFCSFKVGELWFFVVVWRLVNCELCIVLVLWGHNFNNYFNSSWQVKRKVFKLCCKQVLFCLLLQTDLYTWSTSQEGLVQPATGCPIWRASQNTGCPTELDLWSLKYFAVFIRQPPFFHFGMPFCDDWFKNFPCKFWLTANYFWKIKDVSSSIFRKFQESVYSPVIFSDI